MQRFLAVQSKLVVILLGVFISSFDERLSDGNQGKFNEGIDKTEAKDKGLLNKISGWLTF